MGPGPAGPLTWRVALRLGRVSNLPTVWTNTLVGFALAGGVRSATALLLLMFVLSLFYVAGMYLNDAFDAEVDATERPGRPIPAGLADRGTVFRIGYGLIALGVVLLGLLGFGVAGMAGTATLTAGLVLAAAIIAYDWSHKTNALSPLLMGSCRLLVYVVAAVAAAGTLPLEVLIAGGAMWAYIVGTTYIAQQETLARVENLWPAAVLAVPAVYAVRLGIGDLAAATYSALFLVWVSWALWRLARRRAGSIQRVVTDLIAGICLFDAVVLAGTGFHAPAGFTAALFLLTLYLQRWLPGT